MQQKWYQKKVKPIDEVQKIKATSRQQLLTKPPGSLGRLESLAIQFAAMQSREFPCADNIQIIIFAADHGIAEEGVSAFPQVVTTEMIRNFSRGGAAICVLARQAGAQLRVVDVGSANPPGTLPDVIDARIAAGTANFLYTPAMSKEQCEFALNSGREQVIEISEQDCDIFIAGEMGIANTTSATALASFWLKTPAIQLVGAGTGLDREGKIHKAEVIEQAISRHKASLGSEFSVLQTLGGFEITAMCGAYIAAAQAGIPILVDGFISTVALFAATKLNKGVLDWSVFAHRSTEPGHQVVLEALGAQPVIDLDMRLGEASGAAVTINLLRSAFQLHSEMATFEEAGVSTGDA